MIEMDSFDGVRIIENSLNNSAYFPLISAVLGAFKCGSVRVGATWYLLWSLCFKRL